MANPMLAELDAVVLLSERATPGKVELHTSCSWRRIVAERGRPFLVPTIDPDMHQNMDTTESAEFVVALVNWFRTHHAAIRRDAEDAQKWRSMCESVGAEQLVAASEKHGDAMGVLKDAERWRFIVSAPQGCVRTDFVSWLPAYFYWGPNKPLAEQIDAAIAGEKCSADAAREGE